MSTLVSRDPFAREELHRDREYSGRTCSECGRHRLTPHGRAFLYRYSVETDGGRTFVDDRLFCSVGCRRAFYGQRYYL